MMKPKLGDWLIMLGVLAAAFLLILAGLRPSGETVTVSASGELVATLSLSENKQLTIENGGYTLLVAVRDGSCRVLEADCPDRVCVATRAISRQGETIVCVPAEVVVTVMGKGAYDAIAH